MLAMSRLSQLTAISLLNELNNLAVEILSKTCDFTCHIINFNSFFFAARMSARPRLSMAFSSVEDMIQMSRAPVSELSIPDTKKEEILQDLEDTKNIMKCPNFADIEAIDEAITALTEVNDYVKNLSGEPQLKEYLDHILQWLDYIKKTMVYGNFEGVQAISNYYYIDDVGGMVYPGLDEDDTLTLHN